MHTKFCKLTHDDNYQTLPTTNPTTQTPSKNKLQILVYDEVFRNSLQFLGSQHDQHLAR